MIAPQQGSAIRRITDFFRRGAHALWGVKQRPQYAYSFNYIGRGRGDISPYGNGVRSYGQQR